MNKFSNKFKKPCFQPILSSFSQFLGQKKNSLENAALSGTTSQGFLAPCQNLEKVDNTIQRKCPDRQKDRQKDGQTLFYRTLPPTAGGPIRDQMALQQQQTQKMLMLMPNIMQNRQYQGIQILTYTMYLLVFVNPSLI